MSRTLHIVSHSHWDREWHQTFQQFRLRLVRLIDLALETLSAGPAFAHFMLDGQTIVLADYAEIRPERAEELRELIAAGRLLIGPWYTPPDEFLVSGEAIVRNLLQGTRDCELWGGRMAVGYVPDQFGHAAQMPQILHGFGIETAVLWRGVDREVAGTKFTWRGQDGTPILVAALPEGYNRAEHLPGNGQALAERIRSLAAGLEAWAVPNEPLLVLNGGDHVLLDPDLPERLATAQLALGDSYTLRHSTVPAYLDDLRASGALGAEIAGELRSSRSSNLLPGVLSSRIWIKGRNVAAQTLLERQAEPLAASMAMLGDHYPGGELRQAWRYLLQNQAHDSVCGCSIDQVHREMVTRYDWSEQIATAVRDAAVGRLAERIDSVVSGAADPRTLAITLFNGAPVAQGGRFELPLHLADEAAGYELIDDAGAAVPHLWRGEKGEPATLIDAPLSELPDRDTIMAQVEGNRVFGLGIQAVSMRTLGKTIQMEVTVGDQAILSREEIDQAVQDAFALAAAAGCEKGAATIHRSSETTLVALAPAVPACGYRTLLLRPRIGGPAAIVDPVRDEGTVIENEHYRVAVDAAAGGLLITDRVGGRVIGPVHRLVDTGEAGDLYTHCPPSLDSEVRPVGFVAVWRESDALGQTLHLRQVLRVPKSLDPGRFGRAEETVELPVATTVRLTPGDRLVRFSTNLTNDADDHRLRLEFPVPFATDHAHAEDAFAMVRRVAQPDRTGDWAEQPVGTAPHQGVVAVEGDGMAVLLAARGLPEYEVQRGPDGDSVLALTLLRSTGWLSRSDISARPGDAGPPLPTPEAQCHGTYGFEYALTFGAGPWEHQLPTARGFAVDLLAHAAPCMEGDLPASGSLAEVGPASMVLSALKGAEDGRGAILRLYNDSEEAGTAHVTLAVGVARATLTSLAEQDGDVLFGDGEPRRTFSVAVRAAGIVSIRLEV